MALAKLKDEFVPISRFNKGEAGKIFQEVAEDLYKEYGIDNKTNVRIHAKKA